MSTPVAVALVGYGFAGEVFHAPLIAATPGLRLATVVSRHPDKVALAHPETRVVASLDEALADPLIELVVIATPNPLHAPQAIAALRAGKHVVVDKPFALTFAEAEAMVAEAERAGRVLSVFHNRRWDADFLTLRALIAEGTLGDIVEVHSHFDRFRPVVRQRWREGAELGGGLWYDLGPHLIDQALCLFGRPRAVSLDTAVLRPGGEAVDWFQAVLRYDRLRVTLHASVLTPEPGLRFVVHGTCGTWTKSDLDAQEDRARAGVRPDAPGFGDDPVPGRLTAIGDDGAAHASDLACLPGDYRAYYAGVRNAVRGLSPSPVDGAAGVAVMEIVTLGLESAATRREIALAEPDRTALQRGS